jgi:hypothetical protein
MVPQNQIEALVEAHGRLEDPMSCAIWIRPAAAEAWLVECIPTMADDERAGEPTYFGPGAGFRFPLALIVGNLASLEAAIRADPQLAHDLSEGTVVFSDGATAERLQQVAREVGRAA